MIHSFAPRRALSTVQYCSVLSILYTARRALPIYVIQYVPLLYSLMWHHFDNTEYRIQYHIYTIHDNTQVPFYSCICSDPLSCNKTTNEILFSFSSIIILLVTSSNWFNSLKVWFDCTTSLYSLSLSVPLYVLYSTIIFPSLSYRQYRYTVIYATHVPSATATASPNSNNNNNNNNKIPII